MNQLSLANASGGTTHITWAAQPVGSEAAEDMVGKRPDLPERSRDREVFLAMKQTPTECRFVVFPSQRPEAPEAITVDLWASASDALDRADSALRAVGL